MAPAYLREDTMHASAQQWIPQIALRPRLRENVWWVDVKADKALLRTLENTYEISAADALAFLKIRTHCTGHNTVDYIAWRSGIAVEDVKEVLAAFSQTDLFCPEGRLPGKVRRQEAREALVAG